jgi:hypothetical protein
MNPFNFAASTVATIKLVAMLSVVVLVLGYVGNVFYKANKLDKIVQRDSQTSKALKSMGVEAKKQKTKETTYFAKNEASAGQLTKELSNEKAKFDDRARAEYFRVLNDALRGAE